MQEILKRFIEILKPDFLAKNFDEIESGKTWKFWFLSNSLAALILVIVFGFGISGAINEAGDYVQNNYPYAKISIKNGVFSTEGIKEPVYVKSKEDNSVFVIDTKGEKYDEKVLENFKSGVFISSTKIFNKENEVKTQQFDISKIKDEFAVSQSDLQEMKWIAKLFFTIFTLIFIWMYLNIFRLATAAWWAVWFWILAMVMKVENMTFSKVYFVVLNFYFIPLVITLILLAFNIAIPFLTFAIFLALFIMNYTTMNKERKDQAEAESEAIETK